MGGPTRTLPRWPTLERNHALNSLRAFGGNGESPGEGRQKAQEGQPKGKMRGRTWRPENTTPTANPPRGEAARKGRLVEVTPPGRKSGPPPPLDPGSCTEQQSLENNSDSKRFAWDEKAERKGRGKSRLGGKNHMR